MYIKIDTPRLIQGIGERNYQEDACSPSQDKLNNSCKAFAVCDGMGGHEHGEEASKLVAEGLIENYPIYMNENPTDQQFLLLFKHVRQLLDNHPHSDDGERHMGTTFTFVALTSKGVLAAHIGDSTIYVIRPNKITELIYRSEDHTPVYRLVQNQQLSPLQALTYQYRNTLDKAVLPHENIEPDIKIISDIQPGDYILLCTDGVTENLTDEMIRFIFAPYRTVNEISDLIQRHCSLSSDNHTALIIPIIGIENNAEDQENQAAENITDKITPPSIDMDAYLKKEADKHLQQNTMGVNTRPEDLYAETIDEKPEEHVKQSDVKQDSEQNQENEKWPKTIEVMDYSIIKGNKFTSDPLLEETRKKYGL